MQHLLPVNLKVLIVYAMSYITFPNALEDT